MSLKRWVLVSILSFSTALVATVVSTIRPKSPFAKHTVVNPEQKHVGTWLPGKPSSPIRVYLHSPRGLAFDSRDTTLIQAKIQFTGPMDHPVHFRWQLPQGAQVVQGELEGTLTDTVPRQIYKTSITVTGIGIKELPRNVSITVSTDLNGQRIAATGIFASHEMQPDGSLRARRERGPANTSWFSKTNAADDDSEIPIHTPPKGIHF